MLIHYNVFWEKSKILTDAEEIAAIQNLKILSRLLNGEGKNQNMPVALVNSQSDLSSFHGSGPYCRR